MAVVPFVCPDCGKRVRGDSECCGNCGAQLTVTAFTRDEQHDEDMDALGLCAFCERPTSECDADPCVTADNDA